MPRLHPLENDSYSRRGLQRISRRRRLKNQSVCRFPRTSFTSRDAEPRLPHYVVPVLYVPRRIITNEELIRNNTYLTLNNPFKYGDDGFFRTFRHERQYSLADRLKEKGYGCEKLTKSETDIYERLIQKMYGINSLEEVNCYKGDYNERHNHIHCHRNNISVYEKIIRAHYLENESEKRISIPALCNESSSNCLKRYPKRNSVNLSINPMCSSRSRSDIPLFSSLDSSRSLISKPKPGYLNPEKSEKGSKGTMTETFSVTSKISGEAIADESNSHVPTRDVTLHSSELSTQIIFRESNSESKCTQTQIETTVSSQTIETKLCTTKIEKECDTQKFSNVESKAVEAIIERDELAEAVQTVDQDGSIMSDCSEADYVKCDSELLPTVELRPISSSTFRRLDTIKNRFSRLCSHAHLQGLREFEVVKYEE